MKKIKIISLFVLLLAVGISQKVRWQDNDIFEKSGKIVMLEPMLYKYGLVSCLEDGLVETSLLDQVESEGHLCPGVASSFFISKFVVNKLFEEEEIPKVGDLKLTTPLDNDFYSKVARVLRLEADKSHGKRTWFVDKRLNQSHIYVLYFERTSTGKKIKVSFDKSGFMEKHADLFEFSQLKKKVQNDKASEKEIQKFKSFLKLMIDDLVENINEIIKVEEV